MWKNIFKRVKRLKEFVTYIFCEPEANLKKRRFEIMNNSIQAEESGS